MLRFKIIEKVWGLGFRVSYQWVHVAIGFRVLGVFRA